jgi:hypothetical protein
VKYCALYILTALSLATCAYASDTTLDKQMWENAYRGNFSIVNKIHLTRKHDTINDELLNQFAMAYVSYRLGDKERVDAIFKGIDTFIEYYLLDGEIDFAFN